METKSLKIKKESAVDLICTGMKEQISSGNWKVDQKIPSENELAEAFGVNRLTVRLALQKLNTLGILDTRVGEGTFVRPFSFSEHMNEISEFYITPKVLDDISEYRKILEIECARLAMDRATGEELEELREWCVKYETAYLAYRAADDGTNPALAERLYQVANDCDIGFHAQICKMSHNELLIHAFSIARAAIAEFIKTVGISQMHAWNQQNNPTSMRTHWMVYQAIVDKDFETCKKVYNDMIDLKDIQER
ncbi:MAG: GntR family transcriptional regulator [Deltaproteobacteria bacterium]|nr:GntR family transcriptional regulator [Deltaproteobacteria bacterium]